MDCRHEAFGCRNGEFFCLTCGAVIPNPYEAQETPSQEKKVEQEPRKKAQTARKKKGAAV